MKTLFIHAAKCRLRGLPAPGFLMEPFGDKSVFQYALAEYVCADSLDQIILVCPDTDEEHFKNEINCLTSKGSTEKVTVTIAGVCQKENYSFNPDCSRLNPLMLEFLDYFGLWVVDGMEALARQFKATHVLVWNLESFWNLKSGQINTLMESTQEFDFCIQPHHPEDNLLGLSVARQTPQWHAKTLFRRKKTQLLKENYRTLTLGHLPSEAKSINNARDARLDLKHKESGLVRSLMKLDYNLVYQEKRTLLNNDIRNSPDLSLRHAFGGLLLDQMNRLLKMNNPVDMHTSMCQAEPAMPQVMHVEAGSGAKALPEKLYKDTLEHFRATPFWILHFSMQSISQCTAMIEQTVHQTAGTVYLETDSIPITPESARTIFDAGLTVWVLLVDSYLKKENTIAEQADLDKMIQTLVDVRDSIPGKYILLKMQNRPEDIDFIPKMMERWFGIVDGLVVTSSLDEKYFYRYKTTVDRCTVVPYEASLRANGKLAICTELPRGTLSASDPESWRQAAMQAGTLPECASCRKKSLYGPKGGFQLGRALKAPSFYTDLFLTTYLDAGDAFLADKNFDQALNRYEIILQSDPANQDVWERIDKIESQLKN